jgi:hypothetical protein
VFEDEEVDPNSVVMEVTNNKIKELEDRIASLRQVQSDIQTKINKNEDVIGTNVEEESDYDDEEDDYDDDEDDYDDDEDDYDDDEDDYDDDEDDYDDDEEYDEDEDVYDDEDDEDYEYKEDLDDDYKEDEEYNNSIFENENEEDNAELSKVIGENYSKKEQTPKSAVKIIDAEDSKVDKPETQSENNVIPEAASAIRIIKEEEPCV